MDGAIITIAASTSNLNLANIVTTQYGSLIPYIMVTINPGVIVTTFSTGSGWFPSTQIKLTNNGTIVGTNSTDTWIAGGIALYVNVPLSGLNIFNNGLIKGGNGANGERTLCGQSGSYGGAWLFNPSAVPIGIFGNPPINGSDGVDADPC